MSVTLRRGAVLVEAWRIASRSLTGKAAIARQRAGGSKGDSGCALLQLRCWRVVVCIIAR
jgi:hypothetical protein